MSKKVLPDVLPDEVELDPGKLTANQQIEVEEILNADFEAVLKAAQEDRPMVDDDGNRIRSGHRNRALVYVALKSYYPDLTIDEAGDVPLAALKSKRNAGEDEPDETD